MYKKFKFDLARNSLKYLINKYKIKEIYIPYYLCDVIRHSVVQEKCKPLFYHIDDNFYPDQKFPTESYILYPNYFGICGENVDKLERIYSNLIVDNAHAFYVHPQGFACFNAEHKFNHDLSASYLYIKNEDNTSVNIYPNYIYPCPPERIKEFERLHEKYGRTNNLNMHLPVISPFVYPFLASSDEEADKLAKELTKEGKTIYRYWNSLPKNYNEYKFYRRLVPIPLNTNKW